MKQISLRTLNLFAALILALSSIIFLVNHFIYKYQGNNFFPEGIPELALLLVFYNLGFMLCFKESNKLRQIGREVLYYFIVMCVIATATNAVQLTPFPTIDHYIIALEEYFHIYLKSILAWTNKHPQFKYLLCIAYDSLTYQMTILPLIIIVACRFHLIREYYFYLLCTTLIGFGIYYFFPTAAPASVIKSSLFFPEQIDTGLKYSQIHHHMIPTTNEGGLIAFPSFHVIWAIVCLNLLKEWKIPFILLLINNLLLIASCILLGWHYCTDILGAFIVLLISYFIFKAI